MSLNIKNKAKQAKPYLHTFYRRYQIWNQNNILLTILKHKWIIKLPKIEQPKAY